jgi:LmbE family N-acetylglucosaminyl deacetylase
VILPFELGLRGRKAHVIALGAHPDDIEIGCGGTLLQLAAVAPGSTANFVIATGSTQRLEEAAHAAELFMPGCAATVTSARLPDGHLPAHWGEVKDQLESAARRNEADLVLAPRRDDAHQDHRLVAELAGTVWRDHLVLHYEIPKWDGDLGRPSLYVPLSDDLMQEKVALLRKAYPSQSGRDWFDDEVFTGLARLRGMECKSRYAEAFTATKAVMSL